MSEAQKDEVKVNAPKRRPVRKFFTLFFNVRKWVSFDEISTLTKITFGLIRKLFHLGSQVEVRRETYEAAVSRLGLTAEQIALRKKNFFHSAMVYGSFAVGFSTYFIYLLSLAKLMPACFVFILVVLMTLLAYREHFWYMQMEKKKLGCSFREWLAFMLGRTA